MILQTIYLLLPSAMCNIFAALSKRINFLNYPIDFGLKLNKKPLFGKNKTWRGAFFGILAGIITSLIQTILFQLNITKSINILNYTYQNFLIIGILLSVGTILGDCLESMIKRQLNKKPGDSLIILDQLDWVIGSLLAISIIKTLSTQTIITALIVFFILHIITKHIGFYLKLEDKKW
ncbi:CDP-archaeol synthase [Candidatus Woesearchaeota archaeon]|nr:CDP-archaeol synthase [Candidatus Woesearchaeota archaeon]